MRVSLLVLSSMIVAAAAGGALAQGAAAPPMKTFMSAADIVALTAKAKADLKPGEPVASEPILSFAPYEASLEYRVAPAPPWLHEKAAEVMYVIAGKGTLLTGGKLINPKRDDALDLTGTAIANGTSRAIAKGDFITVPQNTPHQFTSTGGGVLIVMTLHVPRPTGAF